MKNIIAVLLLVFSVLLFGACDPSSSVYLVNKSEYDIRIEFQLNYDSDQVDEFSLKRIKFYNDLDIEAGKQNPFIHYFPGQNILEALGFTSLNSNDDIAKAIDQIFKNIYIYAVDGGEKTLLRDKSFFTNTRNFKLDKYAGNYSILYTFNG